MACEFTVTENLSEETTPDRLTAMNGNDRAATVGVAKEMVAALGPDDVKPTLA